MLKNIPVQLSGYRLRATTDPEMKTFKNAEGIQTIATDREGATLYVVSVLLKELSPEGRPVGNGFEVKVTLETDPNGEVEEGQVIELLNPRISQYDINGRQGVSMKATGIKPAA